ncbi:MAG: DUF58 domain-containing protein [Rhodocyclales bacterium]|nr:DUF58 domain-containing protein [Rhodocyclales bacterium]
MRPSKRLLLLFGLWWLLALALIALRLAMPQHAAPFAALWWASGAVLVMVAMWDAYERAPAATIDVVRSLPENLALNVRNEAHLVLRNLGPRPVRLEVADDPPVHIDIPELPVQLTLAPGEQARVNYRVLPRRRGDARFGPVWLRRHSPLGLWEARSRPGDECSVKVFPNFVAASRLAGMGLEREMGAIGVHLQQRRGDGMDFHQLREFRTGDSLRQIDWKATARYRKPISREYQDERDQDILFLLDCGRRMRARDAELSHFDHALNALLLTAQVGLRQGDGVGLLTFAAAERGAHCCDGTRWLAPIKGHTALNRLIHQVYDLHSSTTASDYLEAAQGLLERHRKRAMVILVTNVREEDADDLHAATTLLARRHRVVVASLREQALDERIAAPLQVLDDTLACLGTLDYLGARERLLQQLRQRGLSVIDTLPQQLHVELVAEYLRLKRSNAL